MLKKQSISVIVFLFSSFLFVVESIAADNIAAEQPNNSNFTLELVAGIAKPPFIVEENGKGMQLDLIREALALSDIDVKFTHMPLGRNITGFQRMNADGVITLLPDYQHPGLHLSKPYISYQNVAISLVEKQFSIEKISDLSNKNIMAFQNAKKFLGDEYNETVAYSMDYREVHDQHKQIEMLFLRRVEVIIMDINIFKWFLKHQNDVIYNKPFTVHYIFNEREYSIGFKSKEVRDKFDQGIQMMRESGSYQVIIDNYLH